GIGILTTAEKKGKLRHEDIGLARDWMCTLNKPGSRFGKLAGVTAMTDVTGFGLLGHLVEMADGSQVTARIEYARVPRLPGVEYYLDQGCVPGGTLRNYDSYAGRVGRLQELHKRVLCDPQTSGGLLVAVSTEGNAQFLEVATELGLALEPIGELIERQTHAVEVS
ncbi:MAG: selD, partial [Pseudomonas sp.]|nr:selD [Pseudomonas sp.]